MQCTLTINSWQNIALFIGTNLVSHEAQLQFSHAFIDPFKFEVGVLLKAGMVGRSSIT